MLKLGSSRKQQGRIILISFILATMCFLTAQITHAANSYPERVNISTTGEEANLETFLEGPAIISADNRYVVFSSYANNLVPNDTNESVDVFMRDTQTDITQRISVASDGTQGNNFSGNASISADGRYVAFTSGATNLVPNDTNNIEDIFVRDRQLGITERISVAYDGSEIIQDLNEINTTEAMISANGRYVVFSSNATNLVSNDTNNTYDIFVRDRQLGITERVSIAYDGSEVPYSSGRPSISADGRYVAFESGGGNILVPNDTIIESNGVFVRDRQLGTIEHISVAPDGTEGNLGSDLPLISANGRYVIFSSGASNILPDETEWGGNIFVRDRENGITEKAIVAPDGSMGNGTTAASAISADGRYLTFLSNSSNLVPGDTNGTTPPTRRMGFDVFVYDRESGSIQRVSVASDGTEGNDNSYASAVSSDGNYIAFVSDASNLVPSDNNDQPDIFLTLNPAITVVNPDPVTTTFNSSADTYVRNGADNRNTGAGTFMRLQSGGDNRSLVKFDQTAMQSQIGNKQVLSAKLKVTIVDNGNNWGATGRTIDIHRLVANWTEGNGTESNRGTGLGATWECAADSNITNQAKNCSGTTQWEMGQPNNPAVHPWLQTASATQTITNNQSGVVEFDVTSDVASFLNSTNQNYGWIIKKTNEGQNGQVSFGTKESSSAPQLVVTYQP